ncbi:MAG: hypothetical protein VB070_10965 [Clostridiaceae bacterium]|nr:hypothetical protein [Clostridiaceae bacterium]
MGQFYRVVDHSISFIGSCEDGYIYKGSGSSRVKIGSYNNGEVFEEGSSFMPRKVGSYSDGKVYGTGYFKESIGTYDSTHIYVFSGSTSYITVGTYEGDGAEAAAYLLLMRDELPSSSANDASLSSSANDASLSSPEPTGESPSTVSGGSGSGSSCFSLLGILFILFSFGLIWWAIIQATGPAETPFLVIMVLSIIIGLFIAIVVIKADDLISLYLVTCIVASIINIIASFFTSPGYSIFLILLIPPIVVALASAIPTLLTYIAMGLIRKVVRNMRQRRSEKS